MKTQIFLLILIILTVFQSVSVQSQINLKKLTKKPLDEKLKKMEDVMKGKEATPAEPNQQPADEPKTEAEKAPEASLKSYSKFDFIPGEKVIFFEDFTQDKIGDFPVQWNTNGSGEVVTTNLYDGRWLKLTSGSTCIWSDKFLDLPDNYTVEFDVVPQADTYGRVPYYFTMLSSEKPNDFEVGSTPGKAGFTVYFDYNIHFTSYFSYQRDPVRGLKEGSRQLPDQKYHLSVWIQKERIRIYQNETKIFDLPKAIDVNVKFNRIRFENGTPMVSNIRVAVGAPDMRSKLVTEGKLVTYGIYFDVNKDIVKPESQGTLKEISAVLNENPAIRVKIFGHTDADGDDAKNLDLSKRRAASVRDELVKSFGIDGSRIETDGKGESQPVSSNDTPANKALNRRVEFVKL